MSTERKRIAPTKNMTAFLCAMLTLFQFVLPIGFTVGAAKAQDTFSSVDSEEVIRPVSDTDLKFTYKLSEGQAPVPADAEKVPAATAEPLSEADTQQLLKMLPDLENPTALASFNMPVRSLPKPSSARHINLSFPPAEQKAPPAQAVKLSPLSVTTSRPHGKVSGVATDLTIGFSQPMISLTSHAELAKVPPPVELSPKVQGEWMWLGTQVVSFVPKDRRFPMSTEYNVNIAGSATSAAGAKLAKPVSWQFTTETPTMIGHYPDNHYAVRPSSLMMMHFNQLVSPTDILAVTRVTGDGQPVKLSLATDAELQDNKSLAERVKKLKAGTTVVFKAADKLPAGAEIKVNVGPNIPSAEGPLKSTSTYRFQFRTYGPFVLKPQRDDYKNVDLGGPMILEFSNRIDAKKFKNSMIKTTPETAVACQVYGEHLYVYGAKKSRITYTVEVSRELKDEFGQSFTGTNTRQFNIKPGSKWFRMSSGLQVVPSGFPARFSITSNNMPSMQLKVYAVKPSQYSAFQNDWSTIPKGSELLATETLKPKGKTDEVAYNDIDLDKWLKKKSGNLLLEVTGQTSQMNDREVQRAWISYTGIGVDAFSSGDEVIVWATDINSGKPLSGATVRFAGNTGTTDAAGIARFTAANGEQHVYGQSAIVEYGSDTAFVGNLWLSARHSPDGAEFIRWYTITDRSPYKPGETAHVKGVLRRILKPIWSDLANVSGKVSYIVRDSQGNQLSKGDAPLNKFGAFEFSTKLPENMNLGAAMVELHAELTSEGKSFRGNHYTSLPVQEFRRPEFQLAIKNEGEPTHVIGNSALLSAEAKYYSGGALSNSEVVWRSTYNSTTFSPPGWSEFTFVRSPIWDMWFGRGFHARPMMYRPHRESDEQKLTGHTDANGKHYLRADFVSVKPTEPVDLHVTATIEDVNRQTWTDVTNLTVHPASIYVGVKTEGSFGKKGRPMPISFIVPDIQGKAVAGTKIEVELWRRVFDASGEETKEKADLKNFSLTSAEQPVKYDFQPVQGGPHRLVATVTDSAGRKSVTTIELTVEGGDLRREESAKTKTLTLLPEKKEYLPGETASILVQAPFAPAEGLITVWHDGLSRKSSFHLSETSQSIEVPLTGQDLPGVTVQVDIVGNTKDPTVDRPIPAEATGTTKVDVSTAGKKLKVTPKPSQSETEPGKEVTVDVEVLDSDGHAVPDAEVAVAVVDQSLLSLTNYSFGDPIPVFYVPVGGASSAFRQRENINLTALQLGLADLRTSGVPGGAMLYGGSVSDAEASPQSMSMGVAGGAGGYGGMRAKSRMMAVPSPAPASAPMLQGATNGTIGPMEMADATVISAVDTNGHVTVNGPKVQIRSNFDALANWSPSVVTDANGHASVKFKLPDNLTEYRIMAVASHGNDKFGKGESSLTARLPLMAKPSAPRFLNFGDQFELPVVVHNQTNAPLDVKVAARASNARFTGGQGRKFVVPANNRAEVRIPAATDKPGTAEFQVIAVSGASSDAARFTLPVYTPATTEAFATYGEIDKGAILQKVSAPPDVFTEFGKLEVTTSSTALQNLTDAFLYLHNYPFECSEQIASRMIGVAMLKDVLKAFNAAGVPKEAKIQASMTADIQKLKTRMNSNGKFGLWKLNERDYYPMVSLHVTHALLRAKSAGYAVPEDMMRKALSYVKEVQNAALSDYGPAEKQSIRAFALYVRAVSGERDLGSLVHTVLTARPMDKTSYETLGCLLVAAAAGDAGAKRDFNSIYEFLNNHIVESSGSAQLVDPSAPRDYRLFWSPSRENALLLDAMIKTEKDAVLIPKLLKSLLGGRSRGKWDTTQENAYVIIAVRHYFDKYEKTTPDFIARVWLGDEFAGESTFKGRSNEFKDIDIPMSYLAKKSGPQDLVISKDGGGRLYYRVGLTYAPRNLMLAAMDRGMKVSRTYEAVRDKSDVSRDSSGKWHFKSGTLIRVRLKCSVPAQRSFVALVDPLPAGAEALNEELQGTEEVKDNNKKSEGPIPFFWWWQWNWWTHTNKRDNQVEVFADNIENGTYDYSYVMRATTPGTFVVPPTKAEEMYSPETFGRAATETVVID